MGGNLALPLGERRQSQNGLEINTFVVLEEGGVREFLPVAPFLLWVSRQAVQESGKGLNWPLKRLKEELNQCHIEASLHVSEGSAVVKE